MKFIWRWFGRSPKRQDWSELVRRSASAIRRGEIDLAEWLIRDEGDAAHKSAACLNLLGVIAVSGDDWETARRLWQKAVHIDSAYEPVLRNIRRMYELNTFGSSKQELCLGDESEFQMPKKERML